MKKIITFIIGILICSITHSATQKPNIIFFLADDQRNDVLGCSGNPIVHQLPYDAQKCGIPHRVCREIRHGVRRFRLTKTV
jgi:hypothetical protein